MKMSPPMPRIPFRKRFFDLLLTIPGLILVLPVILTLIPIIGIIDGFPVFFIQERPGLGGKIFKMFKFRTMRTGYDTDGKPLPDGQRITRLGKFLRATSLDELPELFNILLGQMSLVGPRPLLVAYLERYSPEQARRHNVLPGITGWAQVNGRNALTWEEKFQLDVWYVEHWSLGLDVRILLMTIKKVLRREGISAEGQATMHEFTGSKDNL